jgi:hypothetical protein
VACRTILIEKVLQCTRYVAGIIYGHGYNKLQKYRKDGWKERGVVKEVCAKGRDFKILAVIISNRASTCEK